MERKRKLRPVQRFVRQFFNKVVNTFICKIGEKWKKGPMKVTLSVTELMKIFKEIQAQPGRNFEMMRTEMTQGVGEFLTELMRAKLSHFLGREPYERKEGGTNHRNGSRECRPLFFKHFRKPSSL